MTNNRDYLYYSVVQFNVARRKTGGPGMQSRICGVLPGTDLEST